ncbi:hypothetical protein Pcinc_037256 [Petrolisthes cinctipes]|uniref:Uncharacterized protein n=1 Tax=Petrolisthes cinctipes TaxID=88211 RepID=A0AAE1BSS0_PETCI|nr:hypothetical protein Pcinc_037256 [Petrolisthes cinctipes]
MLGVSPVGEMESRLGVSPVGEREAKLGMSPAGEGGGEVRTSLPNLAFIFIACAAGEARVTTQQRRHLVTEAGTKRDDMA